MLGRIPWSVILVALTFGAARAEPIWHVATFNAENLNSNGVGNSAMWCGLPAEDARTDGWGHAPGYGNAWNEILLYEFEVADPSLPDTVELEFFFNHDHEPGYADEFTVEYDSAGIWIEVMIADAVDSTHPYGSNKDVDGNFPIPGLRYSEVASRSITYSGNDYGHEGDVIRLRLRFQSASSWSDKDGLWPTDAGAVQVDDISITHRGGSWFEDFEGPAPWLVVPTRGQSLVDAPEARQIQLSVAPNPFNPRTIIHVFGASGTVGRLEILDLRGRRVQLLHSGEFGSTVFHWNGHDDSGAVVASGVYVVRAVTDGDAQTAKIALVR
jgi:hypothetical protein